MQGAVCCCMLGDDEAFFKGPLKQRAYGREGGDHEEKSWSPSR